MRADDVLGVTIAQRVRRVKKGRSRVNILEEGGRTLRCLCFQTCQRPLSHADLDAQVELHPNVNLPAHLDQLGELHRLLCRILQVFNREDLQARIVDLLTVSCSARCGFKSLLTNS